MLSGCTVVNKVGQTLVNASGGSTEPGPAETKKEVGTSPAERPAEKPAKSPPKKADHCFIPAPGLSEAKINKLWSIAKATCYDVGYVIANDDRSTKNLVCQQQNFGSKSLGTSGSTLTLRVKFATDGIYIEMKSRELMFDALGLGAKSKEVKMMNEALTAGL